LREFLRSVKGHGFPRRHTEKELAKFKRREAPRFARFLRRAWEFQTVPYTERLQTMNVISDVPGLITFS